jgi:hypothetical protein
VAGSSLRIDLAKLGAYQLPGDIGVEGPHPFCSSGGNLGNGRTRTAMYTDSIEQLRGTTGARQVRVRAETALAAFTTPSSGGWIMFGKSPS